MDKEKKPLFNLTILPTPHQEFKNYKEFCSFLNIPPLNGRSKDYQLKQLERYFSWTRDGNKYIVGEVYNQPLPYIENRGKNKPLTESQTLFNTIMLYELLYGANREHPLGEDNNIVSYTKTELKQKLFKLVNKDFYTARKDTKRASKELGVTEEVIKFGDNKTTDKINGINYMRPLQELEQYGVKVDNGIYIYYIKVDEFLQEEGKGKTIYCRMANEEEEEKIRAAGNIGEWEYEKEYDKMEYDDKTDPDTHRIRRGRAILKNKLKILNGTDDINKVLEKILDQEEFGEAGGREGREGREGKEKKEEKEETEDLFFQKYIEVLSERIRARREEGNRDGGFFTPQLLEMIKEGDGLNQYALNKGEFWVNIIEKVRFHLPQKTKYTLIGTIGSLTDKIMTMPGAQVKLNEYMLDWFEDKADNKWGGFSERFLNESATQSKDIAGDVKKFAQRYIGLKGVERSYEWKEYIDETGKVWKVRYSGNKMTFDEINLKILLGKFGEEKSGGKAVIIWNAPHLGELCSNCQELIDLARDIWAKKGWMPIEGYMGGIWDEEKEEEIGCFILGLSEVGIKILQKEWGKK